MSKSKPKLSTSATAKNVDKSAGKLAPPKRVVGRPFTGADDPRKGKGPAKGAPNAGRPRDEWKRELQALASSDAVLTHLRATIAAGPDHPYFPKALDYLTDHGFGKAMQSVDVTSAGEKLGAVLVNGAPLGTQAE
jgi:hypothetical protein